VKDWRERYPTIYAEDQEYWSGKGFEEVESSRGEVSFRGTVTVRRKGEDGLERHDFELQFDYPPGYPHYPPKVKFISPKIERARHQGTDGAPCLFPVSEWRRTIPASEVYAATEHWLGYYLEGKFPRELALYELPEYFKGTVYSVIAPAAVLKSFEGKDRGSFSVEKLLGQDLCVLRSVDGDHVGKDLISSLAEKKLWAKAGVWRWYRLNREPKPMRHTKDLECLLAETGHQGVKFTQRPKEGRHLIGLVFTDEVLDQERLFLIDIGVRTKKQQAEVGKGWPIRAPEFHVVSREELLRRLEGVRALDELGQKSVACFGLGAIGSTLALSLAREGVGSFVLCDSDTIRPGNVVRHALDLTAVGQIKPLAMETALSRISPGVETDPQYLNLSDPNVIATYLRDADVVVAAIGDDLREELLCETVFDRDDPPAMLMVRTLRAGAAFRVALIRPGVDACVACLAEYKEEGHQGWIDVPRDELPDVYDTGCATASRPGAGLTSQQAASFAASRALECLEGREISANHWLWVEQPIATDDERLQQGLTLHHATFSPRPGCAVCGA
jgi:molybdopterin/thiamine biosynthesis adenylyltransferase